MTICLGEQQSGKCSLLCVKCLVDPLSGHCQEDTYPDMGGSSHHHHTFCPCNKDLKSQTKCGSSGSLGLCECRRNTEQPGCCGPTQGGLRPSWGNLRNKAGRPPSRAAHHPHHDLLSPLKHLRPGPRGAVEGGTFPLTHSIPPTGHRQGTSGYFPSPKRAHQRPVPYTRLGSSPPQSGQGDRGPEGRWSPVQSSTPLPRSSPGSSDSFPGGFKGHVLRQRKHST